MALSRNAVLAPIFDPRIMQLVGIAFVLLIAGLATGLPANIPECREACGWTDAALRVASGIAIIERFTVGSPMPFAVAISFLATAVLAIPMAAIIACTGFRKLNWKAFTGSRKAFW